MRISKAMAAVVALLLAASAASQALAGPPYFPGFRDGTQAYNSGVVAGAGPNWFSTFIRGDRCEYRYRTVQTAQGERKARVEVCY